MATNFSNPVKRAQLDIVTVSADTTLTGANSGNVYLLDNATGENITLPALASGKYYYFKFIVAAAFATDNWVVASSEGDNINGTIIVNGASVAAAGEDQINFVASAEQIGDYIELVADPDNSQWIVSGVGQGTGAITATDPA